MKRYIRHKKWFLLASISMGTTMQLSACQDDLALFGLRWAVTSITLPFNQFIRDVLLTVL